MRFKNYFLAKLIASFVLSWCFLIESTVSQLPTLEGEPLAPTTLPDGFERYRFSLETFYGLENEFTEKGWRGINDPSTFHLDTDITTHLFFSRAMERMHCRRYYRHVKTNAFVRVPFCEHGIVLDPLSFNWEEPNPSIQLAANGGYFNYSLFNNTGDCREGNDFGSAFLRRITNQAHRRDHTIGEYVQSHHDFFFETQLPTFFLGAGDTTLGLSTPITPSLSLCRILQNYDSLLAYPDGLTVSEYDDFDQATTLSNYSHLIQIDTIVTSEIDTIIGVDTTFVTIYDSTVVFSHHVCLSSPEWREMNAQRFRTMASNNADYIFFDVRHMPEKGCFCIWCRMRYATLYSGGDPNNPGQDDWDLYVNKYVAYDETSQFNTLSPLQTRRLHNFMNVTQKEAFKVYLDTMHHYGPNQPYGTLGIISVQDLGALNMADYETDFANSVDVPKTEWYTPIKGASNRVFFGGEYKPGPLPCPQQPGVMCGDAACTSNANAGCDPLNYWSILSDYHIPEDIRTAGAFSVLRDVSKYGRTFLWLPYNYLRNNIANNSLRNNQRLRTFLGYGYVLGGMTSTSVRNFFKIDSSATDSFRISLNYNAHWDFTAITDANQIDTVNPIVSQISNIFDADAAMCDCLIGLKAYHATYVLYSEEQLKHYHYFDGDLIAAASILPQSSLAPAQSVNPNALRQGLLWYNYMMQMYGGFNAVYNSLPQPDLGNSNGVSYKYPTGFIADWQVHPQALDPDIPILVPVPMSANDPKAHLATSALVQPVRDALNQVSNIKIPIFRDSLWYKKGELLANTLLHNQVLQDVTQAAGLPDIYVTGHTHIAHTAHAGFYTNDDRSRVAVPLVIEPMYAIPRTHYVKTPTWQLQPLGELNIEVLPANAFDHEPLEVKEGGLIIHIRKGNGADFYKPDISDYTGNYSGCQKYTVFN